MADDDDDQYDVDIDSDDDDEEENQGSDDDTGFFPIDEPIVYPSSQSSETATSASQTSKAARTTGELSLNKYSSGLSASNNYPQENTFEYVGEC